MKAPDTVMSSLKKALRFKQHGRAPIPTGFDIPMAIARKIILAGHAQIPV
jgi:hypothetical protein